MLCYNHAHWSQSRTRRKMNGRNVLDDTNGAQPISGKNFPNSLGEAEQIDHYNAIAKKYDDLYGFWYGPLATLLTPLLELNPDDKIADIGGGTGGIAERISALSGVLKNPICVVDPSEGLIQKARGRPNIIPILATADEFLGSDECHGYNKLLFCQSIHHLPDIQATFRAIHKQLQPGGMCIIIGAAKMTSLPLWKWARENFGKNIDDEADDLRRCGFDVDFSNMKLSLHLTKEQWYSKIRSRIFSIFTQMSDREIEAGIAEIEETLLSTVKNDEKITFKHDMQCIVAKKIH